MIENGGEPQSTLRISSVAGALARDRGFDLEEQLRTRFFERLDARMDSTGPNREVVAVLKNFHRERYRLGIVTFVRKRRISRRLDVWKLKSLFGSVITPDDVTEVKPSPQPFSSAMKELRVNPEDSFVVGDEPVDMLGGKTAGATTVGIPQGFFTKQELERAGADHILSSLVQLRDITSTN